MSSKQPGAVLDAQWGVRFFGVFRAELDGELAAFRTRKTASLFAYLAFHAGEPISKDFLIETFWPDNNASQGRQSLRMAISSLRTTLSAPGWDPDHRLLSDREVVQLRPDGISSDVAHFLAKIESARSADPTEKVQLLQTGLGLWSGPFMEGASDHWIMPQSLELEEQFANAITDLVKSMCEAGIAAEAAEWARRGLSLFPMREDMHVALMRAYSASGNNSLVLKQFEELETMLEDQWGESPGEAAMSLVDAMPQRERPKVMISDSQSGDSLQQRRSFFGRERELEEVAELIAPSVGPRLLNLVGLGGSGKTRLAQRLTERIAPQYEGRAWFVSFVGAESGEQVRNAIAELFGVAPDQSLVSNVASTIDLRPTLLALDNLEHLLSDCSKLVGDLIEGCPSLKILTTSRVPLGLPDERLYPVPPFPLPTDYRNIVALRASPSVQLLTDAAQVVRPGFAVTSANAQSVMLLVRRLEGVPLAIELAAAKLGTLTPAQVIASLSRRIDLETSRPMVRPQHRSLRTVIEWSLALLDASDRRAFAILGVCRGGFDINLAEALLGKETEVMVERLCRCSLVTWRESADEVRFAMLETVREMAVQLLDEDTKLHANATTKHFETMQELTTSALHTTDPAAWTRSIERDVTNILGAIEAATNGMADPKDAWKLVMPLSLYIERKGSPQLWVGPFDALFEATQGNLDAEELAKAHMLLAETNYGLRLIQRTLTHYKLAQKFADETGLVDLRIASRTDSVSAAITMGAFEYAESALNDAISLLPDSGESLARASCLVNLAWVVFDRGNEEESEELFIQSLKCATDVGDQSMIGAACVGLGCAIGHTRYDEAQPYFDRAHKLAEAAESPSRLAHNFYYRALIDFRHNENQRALQNLRRSYATYVGFGVALGQSSLTIGGNIFAALGRWPEAKLCWQRAERTREANQMTMIPCLARDFQRMSTQMPPDCPMPEMPASDQELFDVLFPA
ncbi:MAG: BTAD domain-containing putative transcriptional regulator [Fimbriimonadaceae bacterium]